MCSIDVIVWNLDVIYLCDLDCGMQALLSHFPSLTKLLNMFAMAGIFVSHVK